MTSASSMHEAGHSKPMHWDNPEGWMGREMGGGFMIGDTYTHMAGSSQCMGKNTTTL